MVEKTKERKFNMKALWAGLAVAATAIIVIAGIVLANYEAPIQEDYFVSDGTKLVMALDGQPELAAEGETLPAVTYFVYYYNGEEITGAKVYYKYVDEAAAKQAEAAMDLSGQAWTGKRRNGEYVVLTAGKSQYEGLTKTAVEKIIENAKAAGAAV